MPHSIPFHSSAVNYNVWGLFSQKTLKYFKEEQYFSNLIIELFFKNKAALSCKWGGESISELSSTRIHAGQLKCSSHMSGTSFLQTSPGNPSIIGTFLYSLNIKGFFCGFLTWDWAVYWADGWKPVGWTDFAPSQITRTDSQSSYVVIWCY